ncbi:MAG: 23S rRNA (pseudouridine(1915)-N(3))-methyltransferase RlmH, partial [Clostridia bacterium]|nr:23S rRNA (pseudouridine(1915)-N(3))-methyltransferase RlmH [Clostridia bacterium]
MLRIRLIVTGNLKEPYLRAAAAEYEKRLGAYAKVDIVELKECRIADQPSQAEIEATL